jgi:hypothetical protein
LFGLRSLSCCVWILANASSGAPVTQIMACSCGANGSRLLVDLNPGPAGTSNLPGVTSGSDFYFGFAFESLEKRTAGICRDAHHRWRVGVSGACAVVPSAH